MKFIMCSFLALAFLAPQNDQEAEALMKKVQAKYESYQNISADFTLTVDIPEEDNSITQTGSVHLAGDKFKMITEGQEITTDGETVWTYLTDVQEVQINYLEEDEETFTPDEIFSIYEKNYVYRIKEQSTINGKAVTILEFTPIDKSGSIFKIDLAVNSDHTLSQFKVYESNGVRHIYEIENLKTNLDLAENFFQFTAPDGIDIEIIDLR